jgi:hypothetical protein
MNVNYNPNARYDMGANAAGCDRVSNQSTLNSGSAKGLASDNALSSANLRAGFSAAGNQRTNSGPNVAGAPRSINGT